jgi:predicted enzyme related to lactoylglutathione lyase
MKPADSNRLVHLELHTDNARDACSFYVRLCGWREEHLQTSVGSYVALELGGEIGGGVVQCPTTHPVWLPYVEVRDIVEMTDRARLLGARIMLSPREGPAGWRSVVATPAAGEIAFWQPKR